jgi:hypothetical protein
MSGINGGRTLFLGDLCCYSVNPLGAAWALVGHVALFSAIEALSRMAQALSLFWRELSVLSGNSGTCWGLSARGW